MNCRFCNTELTHVFVDLGNAPASNSFLTMDQLNEPETFLPLKVYVCDNCFLVQLDEYKKAATIFNEDYAYFSSYSSSWLKHAKDYVEMMISRFGYNEQSHIVEIASNDGYLLKYFKEKDIPVLGIEPSSNTAEIAIAKGIPTIINFFGKGLAGDMVELPFDQYPKADLIIGNNVLAHVPDINDFVAGLKILLKKDGVITMEFPHLMRLIQDMQFDTIYHEHFSYLSFYTVNRIFYLHGLQLFDVERLDTHGGSLRIYAKHEYDLTKQVEPSVLQLLFEEDKFGLSYINNYDSFQTRIFYEKLSILQFLTDEKRKDKKIAAYGAAAKGNTLLNYCGIKSDYIDFVVDANPHKQGKFLPGSHIKIVDETYMIAEKPDYVIIFPWNFEKEITEKIGYIKKWGGKFVILKNNVHILNY